MKRSLARLLALTGLCAGLVALPAPSQAVLQGGMYVVTATKQVARNGESYDTLSVSCPSGTTPAWGGYYDSLGDDIRLIDEFVNYGSGASYVIDIVDYSNDGIYGYTQVTVQATCIGVVDFSAAKTVVGTFTVQADNLALGIVSCGSGWYALGASIYFNSLDSTVLTSSPFDGTSSWIARGWIGTAGKTMTVAVRCVQSAALSALRVYAHSDAVSWGSPASATCPAGFSMLTGGTYHDGGDGQAITIDPQLVGRTLQSRSLGGNGSMVTTVVCFPTTNPQVSLTGAATPNLNSTTAQWDFTATDPAAVGGYGLTTNCKLQDVAADWAVLYDHACASPVTESGLHEGTFMLSVTATTSDGRSSQAYWPVTIDHSLPVVAFVDPQGTPHATGSVTLGAQVSDTYSIVPTLTCAVDGAAATLCGSGQSGSYPTEPGCSNGCTDHRGPQQFELSDLADGVHVLHVTPTDSRTNTQTYDLSFKVDTVAPSVTQTGPTAPFTVATKSTVTWAGSDAVSGVAQYGVRWRRAPYNGDFAPWSAPVSTAATATSRAFGNLLRGSTYCFAVDGNDHAGNVSPWTAGRCTAIPLDDRDLADSEAWTEVSAAGWFRGTALATKQLGATLAVTGATVKRVALVAKKCPTCGTVGVYVAGSLIAKVNLAATVSARKLIILPAFPLTTGTVKLKVLSSGKLVQVDALGLSRA